MILRPTALVAVVGLALTACGNSDPEASGRAAASEAGAATAQGDMPILRDGLWRVTTSVDGQPTEMRMCMDRAFQEAMGVFGQQMAGANCSENTIAPRAGGGWTMRSVCDMQQLGRMVTEGTTTGDMRTSYRTEMTTETTDSSMAQLNGTSTTVVEGVHEGPCPSDMSPGDMIGPGGMRMSLGGQPAGQPAG